MPELPEVETVARDLRPQLVVGAHDHRRPQLAGLRTLRDARRARRSRRASSGGDRRGGRPAGEAGRPGALRRRRDHHPPQDDRPALRGAGRRARGPLHPPRARAGRRARAAVPRHPQVRARSGCTARDPVTGELVTRARRRGACSRDSGRSRSTRRSRCATSGAASGGATGRLKPLLLDQSFLAGVGNIYADEALWRARLHPLRTGRHAPAAGRAATCTRPSRTILAEAVERRGSLDRRLHRARRRRLDAGAPQRLPADGRAVPALRPADQADRDRGAVAPTSARGASGCRRRDRAGAAAILRGMTGGRRRGRGPTLDGADRADQAGGRDPRAAARAAGAAGATARCRPRRPADVDPPARRRDPRGRRRS